MDENKKYSFSRLKTRLTFAIKTYLYLQERNFYSSSCGQTVRKISEQSQNYPFGHLHVSTILQCGGWGLSNPGTDQWQRPSQRGLIYNAYPYPTTNLTHEGGGRGGIWGHNRYLSPVAREFMCTCSEILFCTILGTEQR